jgi:hypothetical protein
MIEGYLNEVVGDMKKSFLARGELYLILVYPPLSLPFILLSIINLRL